MHVDNIIKKLSELILSLLFYYYYYIVIFFFCSFLAWLVK